MPILTSHLQGGKEPASLSMPKLEKLYGFVTEGDDPMSGTAHKLFYPTVGSLLLEKKSRARFAI